jgi:hypothetical protein
LKAAQKCDLLELLAAMEFAINRSL